MSAILKVKVVNFCSTNDKFVDEKSKTKSVMFIIPFITNVSEDIGTCKFLMGPSGSEKLVDMYTVTIERNFKNEKLIFFTKEEAETFLKELENSINEFYLYDKRKPFPLGCG